MNDSCPVCRPGECRGYPHLWRRLREDPEKWRGIHDRLNGDEATPEDLALRAYLTDRPCCPGGA